MKLTKPIIFFDLETTGVDIAKDRICQIACIKIDLDGNQTEKELLINPNMPIPKEATEVHGITDEMVADKPTFANISKSLFEFFEGCDIAGYNSNVFDVPLLAEEFSRSRIEFPNWELNFVDVLQYERVLKPNKLADVYKRYTGKDLEGAHNALNDVRATLEILLHQTEGNKDIFPADIDQLCQGDRRRFDVAGKCYINKDNEVCWSFGKLMHRPVLNDIGYLDWVLNNDFPFELKTKLRKHFSENKPNNSKQ